MSSFVKFCLVGIVNTLVDVPTFVTLHAAGLPVLTANIISTSAALLVSYVLNRRFTFPSKSVSPLRTLLYVVITLSGLWVLAPITIKALMDLNTHLHYTAPLVNLVGHASIIDSLVPKLASIVVTLAWNYVWYSRVVFLQHKRLDSAIEDVPLL